MGSRHVPARTVLFEREKNGVTYRIPALLYIPRWSTLLAFAEERLSVDDAHANLLVLRRGTFYHNYVEWEDMIAVDRARLPGHRSMNPCPIYDEFTGQTFLFFIAVLGSTSESYQIITGRNLARLCYVTSSDQGRSWSDVTDLTHKVIGESLKEWATFALGPGHGIQLKSGRLLVPAYTYHINCRDCFGKLCRTTPKAFAFRSDDHGKSWKVGELIPNLHTVECQLVSVDEEDGSNILYCNARSSLGFRVQALSSDGGIVFQSGQLIEKLAETLNGCHGSVIGFPAPLGFLSSQNIKNPVCCQAERSLVLPKLSDVKQWNTKGLQAQDNINTFKNNLQWQFCSGSGVFNLAGHRHTIWEDVCKDTCHDNMGLLNKLKLQNKTYHKTGQTFQTPTWVLYSHPTSTHSRLNLGVYLSPYPRDADSWRGPWVIYEGPSAYSDLSYIELPSGEDGSVGLPPIVAFACLYENGLKSPYEQISFSIFTLYEVIQNLPLKPNVLHHPMNKDKKKGNCKTS
ncbi:sialidase-4-like isoform X1 [Rana temporaria]|uniref:sialidase-4-like isoform X1 n=2 Tax=Rana temporaria TaxID=8407 RepID=UPI001AAD7DD7|nr:sialidase-4-like isoform X1 [Rana temporaria]